MLVRTEELTSDALDWPGPSSSSDSEVLETVSAVLADATSSRVEISMGIYRRLLGQPLKTTDDTIGLVSVRRLRAERKKFLTAAVARKLGGR